MSFLLGMITAFILNHFYNNFRNAIIKERFELEWKRRKQALIEASRQVLFLFYFRRDNFYYRLDI